MGWAAAPFLRVRVFLGFGLAGFTAVGWEWKISAAVLGLGAAKAGDRNAIPFGSGAVLVSFI